MRFFVYNGTIRERGEKMEKARILERLIKENGYSVRSFALKCGIPESTLYTILKKGVGRASVDNIIIICKNLQN